MWGDKGYFYLKKGENACGLANYPIIAYFN